jgi:hypothetical protein
MKLNTSLTVARPESKLGSHKSALGEKEGSLTNKFDGLERLAKLLDVNKFTTEEYGKLKAELLGALESVAPSRAPGWYGDPAGKEKHLAYWDGSGWTGATRPGTLVVRSRRRSGWVIALSVLFVAVIAALAVSLAGLEVSRTTGDISAITTVDSSSAQPDNPSSSHRVSVFQLKSGDCFLNPTSEGPLPSSVAVVPCSRRHYGEVFASIKMEEDETNPDTYFAEYVGIRYEDSKYLMGFLYTQRGIVIAYLTTGSSTVGSAAASRA